MNVEAQSVASGEKRLRHCEQIVVLAWTWPLGYGEMLSRED